MINCIAKASFGFKIKNQSFFDTPTSVDWIHGQNNNFISGYVNSQHLVVFDREVGKKISMLKFEKEHGVLIA